MRLLRLAAISAAALLAACSAATAPDAAPATTWVLHSANGNLPPALVHEASYPGDGQVVQVFVAADTITITGDQYTQRAAMLAYTNGVLTGRTSRRDHGRVTRVGASLHFDSDYLAPVAFDGALDAQGRLSVTQDLPLEGTLATYLLRPAP